MEISSMNTDVNTFVMETTTFKPLIKFDSLKVIYLVIAVFGIIANGTVIVVIGLVKSVRKTYTNGFILNQSAVDLLACVILIFHVLTPPDVKSYQSLGDDLVCRLWVTRHPLWSMLVSSTYNLVVLTFERYLAVVHPIWYKLKFGRKTFVASLIFIWISGPLINSYHWITAHIENGKCYPYQYPSNAARKANGFMSTFLQFLIPLGIHFFCYGRMAWVFTKKKNNKRTLPHSQNHHEGQPPRIDKNARISRNIIKALATVTVGFFLCWVCNSMVWLAINLGAHIDTYAPFYHFSVIMIYVNCCINPVVYVIKFEKSGMKRLFIRGAVEDSTLSTYSTTG